MKKIYYLQTYLVKIGDTIEYNGIKAIVTKELIELNPELFVVKDPTQELLDKAKRDYPVGTVLKDVFGNVYTVPKYSFYTIGKHGSILINDTYVHRDGRWAEVLPLKFITEDGVKIYGDMKTYLVHPKDSIDICFNYRSWNGDIRCKSNKYFYHKENALAYIEKHKEKTLKDYEGILFRSEKSSTIISEKGTYWSTYSWIRDNEPKLYYTKILQLIADDLNDGIYIHERGQTSFHINKEGRVTLHMGVDEGCVYFKSKELAEKARDILGDKVKYLFN